MLFLCTASGLVNVALEGPGHKPWSNAHSAAEDGLGRGDVYCRQDPIAIVRPCLLAVSLLYHGIAQVYTSHVIAVQGCLMAWRSSRTSCRPKVMQLGQCMDALSGQPQPHEDEAVTDPCEDICSAKGKGTPLRVPGLGQEDGPMWMYGGGPTGWKVLIEHLPSNVSDATIGNYCDGQVHICVLSHSPQSRIASALVTFGDLPQPSRLLSSWQGPRSMMLEKCVGLRSNGSESPD